MKDMFVYSISLNIVSMYMSKYMNNNMKLLLWGGTEALWLRLLVRVPLI